MNESIHQPQQADQSESLVGELVLRVSGTRHDGQKIRLPSRKATIGSAPNTTLCLRSPQVQPVHCQIVRGPNECVIQCLAPDTLLNGAAFDQSPLAEGDQLAIGPIHLVVESTGITRSQADGRAEEPAVEHEQPAEPANPADRPAAHDPSIETPSQPQPTVTSHAEPIDTENADAGESAEEITDSSETLARVEELADQVDTMAENESLRESMEQVESSRNLMRQRTKQLIAGLRTARAEISAQQESIQEQQRQIDRQNQAGLMMEQRLAQLEKRLEQLSTENRATAATHNDAAPPQPVPGQPAIETPPELPASTGPSPSEPPSDVPGAQVELPPSFTEGADSTQRDSDPQQAMASESDLPQNQPQATLEPPTNEGHFDHFGPSPNEPAVPLAESNAADAAEAAALEAIRAIAQESPIAEPPSSESSPAVDPVFVGEIPSEPPEAVNPNDFSHPFGEPAPVPTGGAELDPSLMAEMGHSLSEPSDSIDAMPLEEQPPLPSDPIADASGSVLGTTTPADLGPVGDPASGPELESPVEEEFGFSEAPLPPAEQSEPAPAAELEMPTAEPQAALPPEEPFAEQVEEVAFSEPAQPAGDDEEESIEDYMARLLQRVRGDAPGDEMARPNPTNSSKTPAAGSGQPDGIPPAETGTEAEILAKAFEKEIHERKRDFGRSEPEAKESPAEKREDLMAMRELANTSARSAIQHSHDKRAAATAYVQLAGCGGSFLAFVMMSVMSTSLFSLVSMGALGALGLSCVLGYSFFAWFRESRRKALTKSTSVEEGASNIDGESEPESESDLFSDSPQQQSASWSFEAEPGPTAVLMADLQQEANLEVAEEEPNDEDIFAALDEIPREDQTATQDPLQSSLVALTEEAAIFDDGPSTASNPNPDTPSVFDGPPNEPPTASASPTASAPFAAEPSVFDEMAPAAPTETADDFDIFAEDSSSDLELDAESMAEPNPGLPFGERRSGEDRREMGPLQSSLEALAAEALAAEEEEDERERREAWEVANQQANLANPQNPDSQDSVL